MLFQIFIKDHFDEKINNLKITYSNINYSEKMANNVKSILDVLEKVGIKNRATQSMCYETLYKLRKKQLHFLVGFIFFEKSEKKKQRTQKLIDQITEEMVDYSEKSLKNAVKFIKKTSK